MATYSLEEVTVAPAKQTYSLDEVIGAPEKSITNDGFAQGVKNLTGGLVRGAGSIGSTILLPADMINQKLRGEDFFSLKDNRKRRVDIDAGLTDLVGSDPNSGLYQTGKIASEIAGTSALGGVIAKPLAGVSPRLSSSIASGGFNLGNTGGNSIGNATLRTAGGAVSGAVAAGAVNPEDAGTGAIIGGALPIGVKVAAKAGSGIRNAVSGTATNILGLTTGAGSAPISAAYQAGKNGSTSFVDNMRGNVSMADVVDDAKSAISKMGADKAAEYRGGMAAISNDKTVLSFQGIDNALDDAFKVSSFKGKSTNTAASKAFDDIKSVVDEWKQLDPAEYHTPEGLDALKKRIGGIQESIPFNERTARNVAGKVYNSIKSEIAYQAPEYNKVMKQYSDASNEITEIEKALSLGKKTSVDTAMRKLQSLMRNNVQTNYGNRLDLANTLQTKGNKDLMSSIAGQALNSWTPRGLIGAGTSGAGIMSAVLNPASIPALALAAPFASPRLVGEAAYKLGQASGGARNLANSALNNTQATELQRLIATNPNLYRGLLQTQQPVMTSQ
jgi:hypothetical protein